MNKEQLVKMGLNDTQADVVLKELDGAFVPKARFNEVNTELKSAKQMLEQSAGDKEQLERLKNELQAKADEYSQNLRKFKVDTAINSALKDAGAKNTTAVKALLSDFMENAQLDENQNVIGLGDEISKLTSGKDTSFMFDTVDSNPAFTGFTPGEKADSISDNLTSASLADAIKLHLQEIY